MDAEQFCGEHGKELLSGRVSFSKNHVKKFINTYTHLRADDFSDKQLKKVQVFIMIDLYSSSNKRSPNEPENKPNKIVLPDAIFQ
jgi:hypothetical protein